jgi:hypothetical protein
MAKIPVKEKRPRQGPLLVEKNKAAEPNKGEYRNGK